MGVESCGGRPIPLGSDGQREGDAAYRAFLRGPGHGGPPAQSSRNWCPVQGAAMPTTIALPASTPQGLLPAHLEFPCNQQAAVRRKEKKETGDERWALAAP